jgi:hypothetical protein
MSGVCARAKSTCVVVVEIHLSILPSSGCTVERHSAKDGGTTSGFRRLTLDALSDPVGKRCQLDSV